LIEVGDDGPVERVQVTDWKNFNWDEFRDLSKEAPQTLLDQWSEKAPDVESMNTMLCDTLLSLVKKLSHTKSVCRHSKPWFTKELAEQLRLQGTLREPVHN